MCSWERLCHCGFFIQLNIYGNILYIIIKKRHLWHSSLLISSSCFYVCLALLWIMHTFKALTWSMVHGNLLIPMFALLSLRSSCYIRWHQIYIVRLFFTTQNTILQVIWIIGFDLMFQLCYFRALVFAENVTLLKTKSSEHLRTEGVSHEFRARVR